MRTRNVVRWLLVMVAAGWLVRPVWSQPDEESAIEVDPAARAVRVACVIAPRKLPHLKEIYPIEVVATYPHPKGQKAHETVVNVEVPPSRVAKALQSLGLKPGRPARGEGQQAQGPEVRLFLEYPDADGIPQRIPIEQALVDRITGRSLSELKWHFTGSAMKRPDPEKDDLAYGADLTGTLISLFPVTDDTVLQSGLSLKDEKRLKLETNKKVLPKEGTPVVLIIQVP